ncbi:hypothetical protein JCM11251_003537 [Rhodosporidiobolus azoricus]
MCEDGLLWFGRRVAQGKWVGTETMPISGEKLPDVGGASETDVLSYVQAHYLRPGAWLVEGTTGIKFAGDTPWLATQVAPTVTAGAATNHGQCDILVQVKPEILFGPIRRGVVQHAKKGSLSTQAHHVPSLAQLPQTGTATYQSSPTSADFSLASLSLNPASPSLSSPSPSSPLRVPPAKSDTQVQFVFSECSALPSVRVGETQYYGPELRTAREMRLWFAVFLLLAVEDALGVDSPRLREGLLWRLGEGAQISSAPSPSAASTSLASPLWCPAPVPTTSQQYAALPSPATPTPALNPSAPSSSSTEAPVTPPRPSARDSPNRRSYSHDSDTTVSGNLVSSSIEALGDMRESSFELEKDEEAGSEDSLQVPTLEEFPREEDACFFLHNGEVTVKIGDLLGIGSSAPVYADASGTLALKIVTPTVTEQQGKSLYWARFEEAENESRILSRLEGSGVTAGYGGSLKPHGDEGFGKEVVVIMERVEGEACRDWADVASVVRPAYNALLALYSAGVTHRDLHPSNFVVSPDKTTVRIIDFGRASPLYTYRDAPFEGIHFPP